MTISTNWPGSPQGAFRAFIDECFDHPAGDNRRWHRASTILNLPPRAQTAMQRYHRWMGDVWQEAWEDREHLLTGRKPLNPMSWGWSAYQSGGARAVVRDYRLDLDEHLFAVWSHYVCDSGLSVRDMKRMLVNLTEPWPFDKRSLLKRVYRAGACHADWWLQQPARRGRRRVARAATADEPPRFLDLVAANWAGERQRMQ